MLGGIRNVIASLCPSREKVGKWFKRYAPRNKANKSGKAYAIVLFSSDIFFNIIATAFVTVNNGVICVLVAVQVFYDRVGSDS